MAVVRALSVKRALAKTSWKEVWDVPCERDYDRVTLHRISVSLNHTVNKMLCIVICHWRKRTRNEHWYLLSTLSQSGWTCPRV